MCMVSVCVKMCVIACEYLRACEYISHLLSPCYAINFIQIILEVNGIIAVLQ